MKTIIKNQSGRSMVEMLGVLAIIGVLSVGGIAGYSAAMSKFRTNQAIEDVQLVMTEVRTLFSSQGDYNGVEDLASAASGSGATSDQTWVEGIAGDLPFGPITLDVETTTDASDSFTLTITEVPSDSCVIMATSNWGDQSTGFVELVINEATVFGGSGSTAASGSIVSEANDNCSDDAEMVWTFQ